MTQEDDEPDHARRGFLIGAGAVAGLAAASITEAEAATTKGAADVAAPAATPIVDTIASPPLNGRVYRFASMFDFSCEGATSQRAWGGSGVYSLNSSSTLWASFEVPPGTLVRDIEWYVRNASAGDVLALGRMWRAGTGTLGAIVADVLIPPNAGITATRIEVPETHWGPYPLGTKLLLGLTTPTNATIQINGARVGFSDGAGQSSIRTNLIKLLSTKQTGGKFSRGETRTITVPPELCPAGTVGLLLNISLSDGASGGVLRVYPANGSAPYRSMSFGSQAVTQMITVAVPKSRKLRIEATKAVHVLVELAGTIA